MNLFSRKPPEPTKPKPVEFVEPLFDLCRLDPQPDITAFEVALLLRDMPGRPTPWLLVPTGENAVIGDWPKAMARHFRRAHVECSYSHAMTVIDQGAWRTQGP